MNPSSAPLIDVRIATKTVEAEGIAGFTLLPVDGQPLPAFSAGAHIDVHLPGGLVRQYSLCNPLHDRTAYHLGVLRDPASRGGSQALHEALQAGSVLRISAPRNHFPLEESARRSLLFAGGIGITPILAMAERLQALQADFTLHYSSRSPARTAFAARLRQAPYSGRVQFHHDDGDAAQKLDLKAVLATPDPGTHLYVCGPSGYLDAVRATARDGGWPDSHIHFEYFAGQATHSADDRSFDVELRRSGRVIRIETAKTITEALADAGVHIPVSCEQGVCGTCLTPVLEGEVDHKDLYLSPEEQAANDQLLPCCSRAKSARLVLDL